MWVFLALGAALLTSFNPILYKRILRDSEPVVVVWGVTLLSLPLLGIFAFILTPPIPSIDGVFGASVLGSAILNVIAHLASTKALKLADVSLVTPLLIFSPVFTVLISILFLNEIPSVTGMLGVVLVLIGAYAINSNKERGWLAPFKSLALTPGVGLVLLAGLLWAITPLFEKTAILHTQPESPRFAAFIVTVLLTFILSPFVLSRGKSKIVGMMRRRTSLLLAGLIAGTAPILGYTAYSLGYVGYVTTLFKLSTLLTAIWSSLLLKEGNFRSRLTASMIMVIGAILIASGKV